MAFTTTRGNKIHGETAAAVGTAIHDFVTREQIVRGSDIASGGTITVPLDVGDYFQLTGTTAVNFVTITSMLDGRAFELYAVTGLTINNNTGGAPGGTVAILLTGAANKALAAGQTIRFRYDAGVGKVIELGNSGATSGGGTVTVVTATPPISSSGGTTPNITHDNSAVTPSTYTSVTVDAKGHVSAGSNPTSAAHTYRGNPTGGAAVPTDVAVPSTGQVVRSDGAQFIGSSALTFDDTSSGIGLASTRRMQWASGAFDATLASNVLTVVDGNVHVFQGTGTINRITTTNWNNGAPIVIKLAASGGNITVNHVTGSGAGTAPIFTKTRAALVIPSGQEYTLVLVFENSLDGCWTEMGGPLPVCFSLQLGGLEPGIGTAMPAYVGLGQGDWSATAANFGFPIPLVMPASCIVNITISVFSNSLNQSVTMTLFVNGASAGFTAGVYASGATGLQQNFGQIVTVAAGNVVSLELKSTSTAITSGSIDVRAVVTFS